MAGGYRCLMRSGVRVGSSEPVGGLWRRGGMRAAMDGVVRLVLSEMNVVMPKRDASGG